MLASIGTILGLIAGGVGALWFAYTKIMDFWFTDQINTDTSKEVVLNKQLAAVEDQVAADQKADQTAVEAYDKASGSPNTDNSGK